MIQIVDYIPAHAKRFKEVNVQWITRSHVLEEEDIKTLDNPENYILKPGGKIFIAEKDGYVVGSCGYQNFGPEGYEMIKMAVDEDFRGLNIGRKLGEESLEKMKQLGVKRIFLYSNTVSSAAAINLYKKLGFLEIPLGNSEFQRANIKMELFL